MINPCTKRNQALSALSEILVGIYHYLSPRRGRDTDHILQPLLWEEIEETKTSELDGTYTFTLKPTSYVLGERRYR